MNHLDRRISPWFLPLLFVVVLLCINWMGEIVSRDVYSYQVAGLFRQTALICFLMGLVLGAVGRRPRLCITPVYWVILLPYLLFVLFYLFPEQFPWSALFSRWLADLFPTGNVVFPLLLPSFAVGFLLVRGSLASRTSSGPLDLDKTQWLVALFALVCTIALALFDRGLQQAILEQRGSYAAGLPYFLRFLTIALVLGLVGGFVSALPSRRFHLYLCPGALLTGLFCLIPFAIPFFFYQYFTQSAVLSDWVAALLQIFRAGSYPHWALTFCFAAGRLFAHGLLASRQKTTAAPKAPKSPKEKKDPLEKMGWQHVPFSDR